MTPFIFRSAVVTSHYEPDSERGCFICGERMGGYTTRVITVLGVLRVGACAPCVDLPDTAEFVDRLIIERLMPGNRP